MTTAEETERKELIEGARERLTTRLNELVGREGALRKHLSNAEERTPDQLEDWMQIIENDDVVENLDAAAIEQIRAVVAAIGRVDNGTYGYSVLSGEPIETGRLKALPEATLTIDEARQSEGAGHRPVRDVASRDKARSISPGEPQVGQSPGPTNSRDE